MANLRMISGTQTAALPRRLPGWIVGPILLLALAGATIGLILAVFALLAALHIAYGASIERVRPTALLADRAAERPKAVAERAILVPVAPPVEIPRQEAAADPDPLSMEPPAEPADAVAKADQAPLQPAPEAAPTGTPPVLASDTQESEAAPQADSTGSIEQPAAAPAPTLESAATPPPQAKRHHVKRYAVRRRAGRIVRPSPGYTSRGTFEPMFRSP